MQRRNFIRAGSLGYLGLNLGDYLSARAEDNNVQNAKAQSVIYIYLPGGYAHQETFDPKPNAPVDYRGPLSSIQTSIPGIYFSQYLPELSKIANKISIIRSIFHFLASRAP